MAFNKELYKEEYPFKSNYFTQPSGFKQHYLDEGQGTPFLMVHGNPSWSFLYRDMVKAFRDNFRCIVPDHIGCGLSDKPVKGEYPFTLKERIDDLERLINSLNLTEPINIAVHDWGGAIGFGYAGRHPDKVNKLVVLNTAAFGLPSDSPFPAAIWAFRHTKIGELFNYYFNAFSFIASHTCSIKGMSRKIRHGFRAPYDSIAHRTATSEFVLDIPLQKGDRSWDELKKVEEGLQLLQNKPIIVCYGRRDFCFNRYFYNEWKRRFPNAEYHTFNAGHYTLEDAGPEIFELVKKFLSEKTI
jgi:haloalkane dehalogenase